LLAIDKIVSDRLYRTPAPATDPAAGAKDERA
jgi:hypothetical protein